MRDDVARRPPVPPAVLAALASLDPLLARLYGAREVRSPEEVDHRLRRLRSFDGLRGIERAVGLLEGALEEDRRILIVGDFDADGATSAALAVRALGALGARHADFLVPNRFEYGYGLTPEIVEVAAQREPDLIVTVDNGISSHEGVRRARELGIQVLITDHHLPGETLPDAHAIVNPNQHGDNSGLGNLAGVGVVFYVMLALRARLRERGRFRAGDEPNLADLLDLVAAGTVADVAPLDANNRVLVAQGLARIRAGRGQAGLRALLRVAGRDPARATASDLAFAVGPRLNAAGRLTDMRLGIECLLCDDPPAAYSWAERLDGLNRERRRLEAVMTEDAGAQLAALEIDPARALPAGICLFRETWHPGVVGIIASRVKDRVRRPVIAFALERDGCLKGSGRSVPGLHIHDAVAAVAAAHPGLIERFGGHAMAAGVSVRREAYEAFTARFAGEVAARLPPGELEGRWLTDGVLPAEDLRLEVAERVRDAGPWGAGFPEPLFDGVFEVLERRLVGGRHTRLRLAVPGAARSVEAIAFGFDGQALESGSRVHAVYRLEVNRFRGEDRLQLVIEDLRVAAGKGL